MGDERLAGTAPPDRVGDATPPKAERPLETPEISVQLFWLRAIVSRMVRTRV